MSTGGASKRNLLVLCRNKIVELDGPCVVEDANEPNGRRAPVINTMGCFSKMAFNARAHGHIIYDPDEYCFAFKAQRGAKSGGSSASQQMEYPELLHLLTPPKNAGGFAGVTPGRRFFHPNGLVSTLQMYRLPQFIPEIHSATSFRLLKAFVAETVCFQGGADFSKKVVSRMQGRTYHLITEQQHCNDDQGEKPSSNSLSESAYARTQSLWRNVKVCLAQHAVRGDKLVPLFLKFREVVERQAHYQMLERMVAAIEAHPGWR